MSPPTAAGQGIATQNLAAVPVDPNRACPEHDLVHRAQEGDLAAFETLYRDHVGRIYALCLRMAADRRRAEERTQDVFVRAWERLGSFRQESTFGSWLHRIAVNLVLGHQRSVRRRDAQLVSSEELPDGEVSVEAKSSQGVDLQHAIDALPDKARTVFVLYEIEGYRHEEIAALTGLAVGTSRAHLHHARKRLREVLGR